MRLKINRRYYFQINHFSKEFNKTAIYFGYIIKLPRPVLMKDDTRKGQYRVTYYCSHTLTNQKRSSINEVIRNHVFRAKFKMGTKLIDYNKFTQLLALYGDKREIQNK